MCTIYSLNRIYNFSFVCDTDVQLSTKLLLIFMIANDLEESRTIILAARLVFLQLKTRELTIDEPVLLQVKTTLFFDSSLVYHLS